MIFTASCDVAAPPEAVLAAFSTAARVSRWWGPDGYSATFHEFAFSPGAHWKFTLRGLDGRAWAHEIHVVSIEPERVELEHVVVPRCTIVFTFANRKLTWSQNFENETIAESIRPILDAAAQQMLARLATEATSRSSR